MPVQKCAISVETLSRNVLLNERMSNNNVAGCQRDLSVFLFCWLLLSTPRKSTLCFDIVDPITSQVKISMHKQDSLMMDTYSMFVGMMKL